MGHLFKQVAGPHVSHAHVSLFNELMFKFHTALLLALHSSKLQMYSPPPHDNNYRKALHKSVLTYCSCCSCDYRNRISLVHLKAFTMYLLIR